MKYFFLWITLSLAATTSFSQTSFLHIKEGNKWGYADTNGNILVSAKFELCNDFDSDELCINKIDGNYGIINTSFQTVAPFAYQEIIKISSKTFALRSPEGWDFFIEKQIIERNAKYFRPLSPWAILFKRDEKFGIINTEYPNAIQRTFNEIFIKKELIFARTADSSYVFEKNGDLKFKSEKKLHKHLNNDYFSFIVQDSLEGVINPQNEIIIDPNYSSTYTLSKRYLCVSDSINHFYDIAQDSLYRQNKSTFFRYGPNYIILDYDDYFKFLGSDEAFDSYDWLNPTGLAVKKNKKWAFADSAGNRLTDYKYDHINPLGLFPFHFVEKEGKQGLINTKGKALLPCKFEEISHAEGRLKAKRGNVTEFYKINGRRLNKIDEYENLYSIRINGKKTETSVTTNSIVADTNFRFINGLYYLKRGNKLLRPGFKRVSNIKPGWYSGEKYVSWQREPVKLTGIIDVHKKRITAKPRYWNIHFASIEKNYPALAINRYGRYCFVNRRGRSYISFPYQVDNRTRPGKLVFAKPFTEGYAAVRLDGQYRKLPKHFTDLKRDIHKGGTWGYINTKMKTIIPAIYSTADTMHNHRAIVSTKKGYGVIDHLGNEILPLEFKSVSRHEIDSNTFFITARGDKRFGFMNKQGEFVSSAKFKKAKPLNNGLTAVNIKRKWALADSSGTILSEAIYSDLGNHNSKLIPARLKKYGYIGMKGENKIPYIYSKARRFHGQRAIVKLDGKYGVIDTGGNYILKPKFRQIKDYKNGSCIAIKNNKSSLYNKQGKTIIQGAYSISRIENTKLFAVKKRRASKYRLFNSDGEQISDSLFNDVPEFRESLGLIRHKNLYGYIDTNGNWKIPPVYKYASDFVNGRAIVNIGNQWGVLDDQGNFRKQQYSYYLRGLRNGVTQYSYLNEKKKTVYYLYNQSGKSMRLRAHSKAYLSDSGFVLIEDKKNNLCYYADTALKQVFSTFTKALPFTGKYTTATDKSGMHYLLSNNGNIITKSPYAEFHTSKEDLFTYSISKSYGLYSIEGKLILEEKYDYLNFIRENIVEAHYGGNIGYYHLKKGWIIPLEID